MKAKGQTELLLHEMKETMSVIKSLAEDNTSRQMLDFLKEESKKQAARDDAFLRIMGALVQQPQPHQQPALNPLPENRNHFRYGMTNYRPPQANINAHYENTPDLAGSQDAFSFMQQMNNPNYPWFMASSNKWTIIYLIHERVL